jgi:small GTP-binding protein
MAEKKFFLAQTEDEKLLALEEMIRTAPRHKSSESMLAELRARYKRLKEKLEIQKKKKKNTSGKTGIKKEGVQIALVGLTNSGKSSLLSLLTNAKPEISEMHFTTQFPIVGMLNHEGINFQLIDMPAINHETFDLGIANTADILLIMITNLKDLEIVLPSLNKATGRRIIAYNKSDLLSDSEIRKISSTLQSKKMNFCIISCKTQENIEELKKKFVENSGIIRIYTKQPGKPVDEDPTTMKIGSTVDDLAKKIFFSGVKIKETRVTGPSSKFPNQTVGLKHILKDKDIVEFHTD